MTARGIHSCCPEAPSTINVTNNIIQLDGETTIFVNETYLGSQVSSGVLTLAHTPYSAAAVQVVYNSGTLRPNVDYTVAANKVIFLFTVDATAKIHIRSIKVGENISTLVGSDMPPGTIIGWGGSSSTPPDGGWLIMDGTTEVTSAGHELLFTFLAGNLSLVVDGELKTDKTPNYYILKEVDAAYFDASNQLLSGQAIIKT